MHYSHHGFMVIGGVASATAFVTALIGYAFGFDQNLIAGGLYFLATYMTIIALAAAGWLNRSEKAKEADCGHELDQAPLIPIDESPDRLPPVAVEAASLDQHLNVERLSEAVSGCSPFVHTLGEQIESAIKDTETAATTVIAKLQRADNILGELVKFLKESSSEKIIPIIEETQECLRTNNEAFSQFLAYRTEALWEESRSRLSSITDLVESLGDIVHSIREVARQTHLSRLTPQSKLRGLERPGVGSPWWHPR